MSEEVSACADVVKDPLATIGLLDDEMVLLVGQSERLYEADGADIWLIGETPTQAFRYLFLGQGKPLKVA